MPEFSKNETEVLVSLLASKPDLVAGKLGGEYSTNRDVRKAWDEIAHIITASGTSSCERYGPEIKKKWQDLKYRVKRKLNDYKKAKLHTEGPFICTPFSSIDDQVLHLIGTNVVHESPEDSCDSTSIQDKALSAVISYQEENFEDDEESSNNYVCVDGSGNPDFTKSESEILVSLLASKPDLVAGKLGGEYSTNKDVRKAWEEIAQIINNAATSTSTRNGPEMKKKWQDLKYRVKKKFNEHQKSKLNTGGGPPACIPLSGIDKKVLRLLGIYSLNQPTEDISDSSTLQEIAMALSTSPLKNKDNFVSFSSVQKDSKFENIEDDCDDEGSSNITNTDINEFTGSDTKILLSLLASKPDLINSKLGGEYSTNKDLKKAWEEVAQQLNATGKSPYKRYGPEVKKKWQDLKYRVKKKLNENQKSGLNSDGPFTCLSLNNVEEQVLQLLGFNDIHPCAEEIGDSFILHDREKDAVTYQANIVTTVKPFLQKDYKFENIEEDDDEEEDSNNISPEFNVSLMPARCSENRATSSSTERVRKYRKRKKEDSESDIKTLISLKKRSNEIKVEMLRERKRLNKIKEEMLIEQKRSNDMLEQILLNIRKSK